MFDEIIIRHGQRHEGPGRRRRDQAFDRRHSPGKQKPKHTHYFRRTGGSKNLPLIMHRQGIYSRLHRCHPGSTVYVKQRLQEEQDTSRLLHSLAGN